MKCPSPYALSSKLIPSCSPQSPSLPFLPHLSKSHGFFHLLKQYQIFLPQFHLTVEYLLIHFLVLHLILALISSSHHLAALSSSLLVPHYLLHFLSQTNSNFTVSALLCWRHNLPTQRTSSITEVQMAASVQVVQFIDQHPRCHNRYTWPVHVRLPCWPHLCVFLYYLVVCVGVQAAQLGLCTIPSVNFRGP